MSTDASEKPRKGGWLWLVALGFVVLQIVILEKVNDALKLAERANNTANRANIVAGAALDSVNDLESDVNKLDDRADDLEMKMLSR